MKHRQPAASRWSVRIASLVAIVAAASVAVAQYPPKPRNHVEDLARVIDDGVERQLIAVLAELERKTSAQFIVLTIDTTGGVPIDDYALSTIDSWEGKLGQEGKGNGVLVVIAVQDRKYRIEVGYGLEGALPDGFVGSIGRDYFRPHFRRNDYTTGIQQGTLAIVRKVAEEYNVTITDAAAGVPPSNGQPATRGQRRTMLRSCGALPFILLIVGMNIFRSRVGRHRRWGGGSSSWLTWMLLGSMMGGGRRYGGGSGWGGGGFGGGGFGGGSFGGGGGGGFGGGGAGGSW